MRIIDAEALAFDWDDLTDNEHFNRGFTTGVLYASEVIDNAPTIEAKPVVHAHWEKPTHINGRAFSIYHCSACGGVPCGIDSNTRYCPNCGAQMDGTDTNVESKGVKIPVISMEDVPKIAKEMEK